MQLEHPIFLYVAPCRTATRRARFYQVYLVHLFAIEFGLSHLFGVPWQNGEERIEAFFTVIHVPARQFDGGKVIEALSER